jgi:hypothetical protein
MALISHEEKLQEQLNRAATWGDLVTTRLRVLELSIHGSLAQAYVQALLPLIHQRGMVLWTNTGVPERDLPTVSLIKATTTLKPVHLIIDGHNLLFRLGVRYGPNARSLLIQDCADLIQRWPSLQISLWFDGDTSEDIIQSNPRLMVKFAGGKGRDKADKAILQALYERHQRRENGLCLVVSDDKGVWRRALGLGGVRVCCAEFLCLLAVEGPGAEAEHH